MSLGTSTSCSTTIARRLTGYDRSMDMRLDVYVNYRGTCEPAFRFYEQHLGGKVTGMIRHRDQPDRQTADEETVDGF